MPSLYEKIEELIRSHVYLGKQSATGFELVKCQICNDYKERGGFKFSENEIGYNCFNCGTSAKFEDDNTHKISHGFTNVLLSFGISKTELKSITAESYLNRSTNLLIKTKQEYIHDTSPIDSINIPYDATIVSDKSNPLAIRAYEYLKTRKLENIEFPFFVSEKYYPDRIIIPYIQNSKCVYFQARALTPEIKPRYKNPYAERGRIIFNYNELLNRYSKRPIFVTEGVFDALSIGQEAIAITGGKLSKWMLYELKQIKRKIIFVLDKNNPALGNLAIDNGWNIAIFPDGIIDSNHALITYGRLWLLYYLMNNNYSGMQAKLLIKMHCKETKVWKK